MFQKKTRFRVKARCAEGNFFKSKRMTVPLGFPKRSHEVGNETEKNRRVRSTSSRLSVTQVLNISILESTRKVKNSHYTRFRLLPRKIREIAHEESILDG